jgi:glycosyltransferase involved in cell wall biosynthesis
MIILVQTNLHGHRAEYLDHAIAWATARGEDVLVWIQDQVLSEAQARFSGQPVVKEVRVGPVQATNLIELRELYKDLRLIFLDGDRELVFGLRHFRLVSKFRPTYLLMRLNRPTKLFSRELAALLSKFVIAIALRIAGRADVKRLVFLEKARSSVFRQVRDPLPVTQPVNSTPQNLNGMHIQIGIVGTLDERKSIELAIESLDFLGEEYELKLIGQVTPGYRDRLIPLVSRPSVELVDKFLTEVEMSDAFRKLDCFLVLQKVNAPSGTILRALDSGLPVVLGGSKVLKAASRAFPESVFWTELTPRKIAESIILATKHSSKKVEGLPTTKDFANDLLGDDYE